MAIYHLHVKVIGRKSGSSAVASAAYRAGSRLRDERLDRGHDFSAKRSVVHSEVMLPENAPEAWSDRERLWNDVEAFEVRKDAQLAREVEFAIPREMTEAQGIELARDFVRGEFVDRGMIADLNVHWDMAEDGSPKPHAHVMLTMRAVHENGFGPKVREWNRTEMVARWRERWAEIANERLAELDIDARIDHRSLEAQGIALESQTQIGAPAKRIEIRGIEVEGLEADRAELHREIARNNGDRIYELVIAPPKRGPFKTSSGVSLVAGLAIADVSPAKCRASDTVMAAGGDPGLRRALESGEIAALIKAASRRGSRIVSVCTGTFFLAAAGLLDGRRAATHWNYVERLRRFRPQVDVDPEAIYLRDGNVWTSAGVTAGIDLALALIEADFGRSVALAVARRHVVFRIRPGGQGQFSPELAAQGIRDQRLSKLAEKIAEEPKEDWRTDTLAAEAGVSLRSLSRLFRKELNASPSEFVERVRIDQARRALLETEAQIESVAIRCGFGSLRRMDRAFSRAISATPTEFRARFKPPGATA